MKTVVIIGCGRVARHHAKAIEAIPDLRLGAVCDLDQAKARALASEYRVPWFTDYRRMLAEHDEAAMAAVITPSGMHLEHAQEVISNFGKSVVLEKPPTLRTSDLESLWSSAEKHGVSVFPVFQNRYNLAVQRVLSALDDGELGAVRLCSVRVHWNRPQRYYDLAPWRGTWALDGGCLTNQGIHHLDLMRLVGGNVVSVACKASTQRASIEVEDSAVAIVTFASGALGTIEITTAAEPRDWEASLSLVCDNGVAKIGGVAANELQLFSPDTGECDRFSEDFSESIYGSGHFMIYERVAEYFESGRPFPVSREDARATLDFLNALYLADETASWVDVAGVLENTRLGSRNEALAELYRVGSD